MTTKELEKAKWEAYRDHDALVTQRRDMETERRKAFEAQLQAELDGLFAAPLAVAAEMLKTAEQAHNAAVEADALAQPRKLPLGTKMEEWQRPKYNYGRKPQRPTGRMGVLEIVTAASEFPERGYPPPIGTEIIRLLKKDGSLSKKYVSGWAVENEWRPAKAPGGGGGAAS